MKIKHARSDVQVKALLRDMDIHENKGICGDVGVNFVVLYYTVILCL